MSLAFRRTLALAMMSGQEYGVNFRARLPLPTSITPRSFVDTNRPQLIAGNFDYRALPHCILSWFW
jgi:hypothetical protein